MLPACVYGCYVRNGKTSHMNRKRRDATDDMTPKLIGPFIFIFGIIVAIISTLLSKYISTLSNSTGKLQLTYLSFQQEVMYFLPHTIFSNLQDSPDIYPLSGVISRFIVIILLSFANCDSNT